MRHYANTGDGLLTALHLMQAIASTGKSLKELSSVMSRFPQVLINVKDVEKSKLAQSSSISEAITRHEAALATSGRILVRPSGTERLVRVMVEAQSKDQAEKIAEDLASLVRSELTL